jgi:ATP-dependent Clp protease protease subunit
METNRKGYYDIDLEVEEVLTRSGSIDEIFYLNDLKQRKLFLNTEIDQYSVSEIVKHILQFNKDDIGLPVEARRPILLYVSSNGGCVDAGFELIDVILCSKTPVYTINLGYQYSMGFLIGLAGHKRFATSNAKFLMHDGSNFVYTSGGKARDEMEFQGRVEKRIKDYILSRSSITSQEYDSKFRIEWYLFASEAKDKGIVDYIIGTDCDLDEII